MNDTSSSRPARPTLKLKVAARKPADSGKTAINPQPDPKRKPKPGADWSEEYKRRMQEDMDALLR